MLATTIKSILEDDTIHVFAIQMTAVYKFVLDMYEEPVVDLDKEVVILKSKADGFTYYLDATDIDLLVTMGKTDVVKNPYTDSSTNVTTRDTTPFKR